MDIIRKIVKRYVPKPVFQFFQPFYHFLLAWWGDILYKHPSRDIIVIAVTGTKGKSTTTELIAQILHAGGLKVASLSTIQFTINGETKRNMFKMTMPGRFFVQKFLREAVDAGCTHAIVEMTSEGARQYRHRFIELDALVFTNLTPEHIESHGSFEKYKKAKLSLAEAVFTSPKRPRVLVVNVDDVYGAEFLNFAVEKPIPYSLQNLTLHTLHRDGISMVLDNVTIRVPIVGRFNVYNVLAAIKLAEAYGVPLETAAEALRTLKTIAGRVEHFTSPKDAPKQITAVVDYAHTPDSLEQFYQAFPNRHKICILGNTGGGRDTWKRPEMASIAEKYCDHVILTNEDPYDEDPGKIVADMAKGITDPAKLSIIMDRKEAIEAAVNMAPQHGYVLISGKGTDPYIMGPNDTKIPWSDAATVRSILAAVSAD